MTDIKRRPKANKWKEIDDATGTIRAMAEEIGYTGNLEFGFRLEFLNGGLAGYKPSIQGDLGQLLLAYNKLQGKK